MLARSRSAAVLFAAIVLLPAGSARAAIGYVGTIGTASSATVGTTLSVAVPAGGVAAGDSIILVFTMPDLGPPVTATDSQGNVYTVDADAVASGSVHTVVFSARNVRALAAGDTITVTHPAAAVRAMTVSEFSGLAGLDRTATGSGSGTAVATAPTLPTVVSQELLIGAVGVAGSASENFTAGTGFTTLARAGTTTGSDVTADAEYAIVDATDAYVASATLGVARTWAAAIATYEATCGNGTLDPGEQCDLGSANGAPGSCCSASCTFVSAGTVCRPAAGACDLAEVCSGTSSQCPADAFAPPGTVCHAATGPCDTTQTCTGTSPLCPPDTVEPAGYPCPDDGNPCTLDECDGTTVICQHPPGNAGAVCRQAAGPCDLPSLCTGTSATCPPDVLVPAGTVCRPAVDVCDVPEACTGTSPYCPPDLYQPAGTVCRPAAGACDVAESCTGTSPYCPPDQFQPPTTVCRPAAGLCDVAEHCTGTSALCPPDSYAPGGTVCRPPAGPCDVAEICSGTSVSCPPDSVRAAGAVCRPAAGPCDVPETCDGVDVTCPPDGFVPAGVVCRPAAGACDLPESCTGTSAACPPDAREPAGTVCRPAAGPCDLPETCDGTSVGCPPDALAPAGTLCGTPAASCAPTDHCDGTSIACPPVSSAAGAFCPCLSPPPAAATKAKLVLKGFNRPPGQDRLVFKGVVSGLPTTPPLDPVASGIRLLIEGANGTGNVLDVTVPPGAFSPTTGTGWKGNAGGTNFSYRNPAGIDGITKVRLRVEPNAPGLLKFAVVGKNGVINAGYPIAPAQLPLTAILVLDTPIGANGQCGQASFAGSACRANLAVVRCD